MKHPSYLATGPSITWGDSTPFFKRLFGLRGRVEQRAGSEYGAGDIEISVGDGAEGSAMRMAALAQLGASCAASWIVLHGDAHPATEGVGEAIVAGLAAHDDATLSGSLGHRRDHSQTSQGRKISPLQWLPGFGEQRGEDGPA
jgi:hypothetical protein